MTARPAPVETVIFDAGLTLLRAQPSFWEVFADGCRGAGVLLDAVADNDREPFAVLWRAHEQAWREAGEPSPHIGDGDAERRYWAGLYRRFLDHLDIRCDRDAVADAVYKRFLAPGTFRPYAEVPGVLERLAGEGLRLAVLSNWGPWLRDVLAYESLLDRFETVVVSGEVGVAKPDPRIYHRALDELDLEPGPHVAYVGDDVGNDIAPSRALGLTAVLIDRAGRHGDFDGPRVTDLSALPAALGLDGQDTRP